MLSSGWFTGVCSLNANVSEHCLFHLHWRVGKKVEHTVCSETLEFKRQTSVIHPEESIQHSEGESLKSGIYMFIATCIIYLTFKENLVSDPWRWRENSSETCRSYQYSETNVMHFLFNLLRIKGLYMFRAILAHPQEALHKLHLVYCVRVMSGGFYQRWNGTRNPFHSNPGSSQLTTRTQYTKCRLCSASWRCVSNTLNT
jgi:hypothetical protein